MSKADKFFEDVVTCALQGHEQKPTQAMSQQELREFSLLTEELHVEMALVSNVDAKQTVMRNQLLFITSFTAVSLMLGVDGSRVAFFGCLLTLGHYLWREFIVNEAVRQANVTLAKFNALMGVKKNQDSKEEK